MSNLPHAWTQERVDELKALHAQGLSASQIARRMHNVTRNGVIGKLHRLGINHVRPISRKHSRMSTLRGNVGYSGLLATAKLSSEKTKKARDEYAWRIALAMGKTRAPKEAEPLPPPSETDIARVSFADLEPHHCRFIPGDPKASGKLYCGCDAVPGLPYCEAHAARCFDVAKFDRQRVRPFAGMRENSHDTTRAVDKLLGDREHA